MVFMTINTQGPDTVSADVRRWPTWRVWSIRVWYGLLSLLTLSMGSGAIRLVMGEPEAGQHFGFGAVTVLKFLAMGGVFAICWTGGRSVVAFQFLVVGSVAWSVSEMLWALPPADSTPVASALSGVVVQFLPLILLRPHRRELLSLQLRPSAVLLALAVLLAVPAVINAAQLGGLAMPGADESFWDMSSLWVVVAVQALFAALRPRDSRWLPRIIAVATGWLGLLAVLWPEDLASPGRAWGAALIVWAILFGAAAELGNRQVADSTAGAGPGARGTPRAGRRPGAMRRTTTQRGWQSIAHSGRGSRCG